MWNTRENAVRRLQGREGVIAVAVDEDKSSRYAVIWALDNNIVRRGQTIKLVHVAERLPGWLIIHAYSILQVLIRCQMCVSYVL